MNKLATLRTRIGRARPGLCTTALAVAVFAFAAPSTVSSSGAVGYVGQHAVGDATSHVLAWGQSGCCPP